ncbi:MAG: bifunctional ADP-dependent NAD(P)H-hydrate dehydratase/NAD(P)H-hydrate epimerase [Alphaproteobacteria bacterium CG_4_9_14_3_um_filter_47_13]|nr:MAG: bifunctional ADP-dependent NAD(P)H-hydrate dehydratase/NAD(P)H-hydrate epimerase [Alphaproteobacteria bacterium CG_4_9_14_3_um_filter_47_13]
MLLGLQKEFEDPFSSQTEVLTNAPMREADRLTVESGISGYELMVAAGQSVTNIVHEYYGDYEVLILCGSGNNGGDGFIAAMFLESLGHKVTVMGLVSARRLKGDARQAYKSWGGKMLDFIARPDLPEKTVVVDAVFGTGLSKNLESPVTDVFKAIRDGGWPVVAVDIPSGVNSDNGEADPQTLAASRTVTFFRKKAGHMLMPAFALCGHITVHDIGIEDDVLVLTGFSFRENAPALWQTRLPKPKNSQHKYSRGHVVMLGGTRMTGAARLASEAAMRCGAGLCTIVADQEVASIYKRAAAHVLYEVLETYEDFIHHLEDERRNAVLIGPGAGLEDRKGLQQAVLAALATEKPLVLDADALTCFADMPETLYKALHKKCVLTPHEGEFAKLFPALDGRKLEKAVQAAEMTGAVILLKGADTIIAQQGHDVVVNTHATPWLATAGAGDVLAGLVAGFLAQNMTVFDAACAGAWIHGETGDRKGAGLVAPDLVEGIPAVIRDLL